MPGRQTNRVQAPECVELKDVRSLDQEAMESLLLWVDDIPLSRPKKHLGRDFADGVLVAELIKFFLPKSVDIHSFTPSNSLKAKEENWQHLNRKVLCRLGVTVSEAVVRDVILARPGVIEHVLTVLRRLIDQHMTTGKRLRRLDPEFLRWVRGASDKTQRKPDTNTDLATLEDMYHQHGLKTLGKEPRDTITNSELLSPHQKRSILALTEMIPKHELDTREQIVSQKDKQIQVLHGKIKRLEHLLHLKDIRINDLHLRVDTLEARLTNRDGRNVQGGQLTQRGQGQGQLTQRGQGQGHLTQRDQGQGQLTRQGQGQGHLTQQVQGHLTQQGQGHLTQQGQGHLTQRGPSQGQPIWLSQGQQTQYDEGQGHLTQRDPSQGHVIQYDLSQGHDPLVPGVVGDQQRAVTVGGVLD